MLTKAIVDKRTIAQPLWENIKIKVNCFSAIFDN